MMGAERRSMVMTEEEEADRLSRGRPCAASRCRARATDPIHKATIIPRGRALGMVDARCPSATATPCARARCTRDLADGHSAAASPRRSIFGPEKVHHRRLRRHPAWRPTWPARWSRSGACRDRLGRVRVRHNEQEVFLGHSVRADPERLRGHRRAHRRGDPSLSLRRRTKRPARILTDNLDDLHTIAKALLEYETLSGDEIQRSLRGERGRCAKRRREEPQVPTPPPSVGAHAPDARAGPKAAARRRTPAERLTGVWTVVQGPEAGMTPARGRRSSASSTSRATRSPMAVSFLAAADAALRAGVSSMPARRRLDLGGGRPATHAPPSLRPARRSRVWRPSWRCRASIARGIGIDSFAPQRRPRP
jgi:hypothetical protein